MDTSHQPPDERALRADLADGPFQLGVHDTRWNVGSIAWPYVHVSVSAAPRENAPSAYCFRFDCSGYQPAAAVVPALVIFFTLQIASLSTEACWSNPVFQSRRLCPVEHARCLWPREIGRSR